MSNEKNPADENRGMTTWEVARVCGIDENMVLRWIHRGIQLDDYCLRLNADTSDGRILVTTEAVMKFRRACAKSKIGRMPSETSPATTLSERREQRIREQVATMLRNFPAGQPKGESTKPEKPKRPQLVGDPGFSPSAVAAVYGVHPVTIIRWITNGARGIYLQAISLGGCWRVTQAQLDDFFDRCTRAARGEPKQARQATPLPGIQRRIEEKQRQHEETMASLRALGVVPAEGGEDAEPPKRRGRSRKG